MHKRSVFKTRTVSISNAQKASIKKKRVQKGAYENKEKASIKKNLIVQNSIIIRSTKGKHNKKREQNLSRRPEIRN